MRAAGVGLLAALLLAPVYAAAQQAQCTPHTVYYDEPWSAGDQHGQGYTEHGRYHNGQRTHHYASTTMHATCEYKWNCTVRLTIDSFGNAGEFGTNDWHPLYQHIIQRGWDGPGIGTCTGAFCESSTWLKVGYAVASCWWGNCSTVVSLGASRPTGLGIGIEFSAGGAIPWHEGLPHTGLGASMSHTCGKSDHRPAGGGGPTCPTVGPGGIAADDCGEEEPTCNSQERSDCISNCGDWYEDTCTCYIAPGGCGCDANERSICEQENGDWDEETCTCRY